MSWLAPNPKIKIPRPRIRELGIYRLGLQCSGTLALPNSLTGEDASCELGGGDLLDCMDYGLACCRTTPGTILPRMCKKGRQNPRALTLNLAAMTLSCTRNPRNSKLANASNYDVSRPSGISILGIRGLGPRYECAIVKPSDVIWPSPLSRNSNKLNKSWYSNLRLC